VGDPRKIGLFDQVPDVVATIGVSDGLMLGGTGKSRRWRMNPLQHADACIDSSRLPSQTPAYPGKLGWGSVGLLFALMCWSASVGPATSAGAEFRVTQSARLGGDDNVAVAFDPRTSSISAGVKLPGSPEAPAADGKGRLFVNLSDTSEIAAIDTRTWAVEGHWPIGGGCKDPTPLAIDPVAAAAVFW
jgi:hypothetical protein